MPKNKTEKTPWLSKDEVEAWLNKMGITQYTINDDLTVDVKGSVLLIEKKLNDIPIQFGIVTGSFSVYGNNLNSLKGCPIKVGGNFNCSKNKLTSLIYCPKEVGGEFLFLDNKIRSLEHSPESVGTFACYGKDVKTLKGFKTQVNKSFIHRCIDLAEKIDELKHLYVYKENELYECLLVLSPQQLNSLQQEEELSISLPINKEKSNKKPKL